jgi:hypothetical protein
LYEINQPISITRVFHMIGVDPATGLFLFADKNGNPTATPNLSTDRTLIVDNAPKFYGGFRNTIQFAGFELDAFFQFVKQTGVNYKYGNFPGQIFSNQPASILPHWEKPGDVSTMGRFYGSNINTFLNWSNLNNSDVGNTDASYVRLKNVSLSWQLPEKVVKTLHVTSGSRIYVLAQNLLTITKYPGLDPENRSSTSLPPLRLITVGVQVGF